MRTESQEQSKIIEWLTKNNYYVIKTDGGSSKSGVPDIVACSPDGVFTAVEVKRVKGGVVSPLQRAVIHNLSKKRAKCFVAYGYEDFLEKIK